MRNLKYFSMAYIIKLVFHCLIIIKSIMEYWNVPEVISDQIYRYEVVDAKVSGVSFTFLWVLLFSFLVFSLWYCKFRFTKLDYILFLLYLFFVSVFSVAFVF